MQYTPNYNLNKFDSADYLEPNSRVGINDSMDIIDTQLKTNADGIGSISTDVAKINAKDKTQDLDIKLLKASAEGKLYTTDEDDDVAYVKDVNSNALPVAMMTKLGGRSIVANQLNNNALDSGTNNGITFTKNNDGTWTLNGTATANASWGVQAVYPLPNHKYAYVSNNDSQSIGFGGGNTAKLPVGFGEKGILSAGASADGSSTNFIIRVQNGTTVENKVIKVVLVDLSVWFGQGNEPTIDEFVAIAPNILNAPYNTGSLESADTSKIVSYKADNTVLAEIPIPQAIQDLELNKSAGDVYDEVDFDNRKGTQRVGSVDLGTLSYTKYDVAEGTLFRADVAGIKTIGSTTRLPNITCPKYVTKKQAERTNKSISMPISAQRVDVINSDYSTPAEFKSAMQGVMLYFELATPIETDLSDILTDDFLIEVEGGGTIEFVGNEDYNIPVPSTEIFYLKTV